MCTKTNFNLISAVWLIPLVFAIGYVGASFVS